MGTDNIFICGADEHGTPTELAAAEEKLPPKEYADKYYKIQKDIYEKWNFDFTFFGRTSSEENKKLTQDIFLSMLENGYILKEDITLPYCKHCRRFLPDRYTTGTCPQCGYEKARGDQCESCGKVLDTTELKDPRCAVCGKQDIEFRIEKHLFLNFPLLQRKLEEFVNTNNHWPYGTRNFALGWLREGLRPRCITRNLEWGIPVPLEGYEHLKFYVWMDGPIGYIGITQEAQKHGKIENWKLYWKDSKIYYFIGKDNVPFHTIFWPGMILAARDSEQRDTNFSLPYNVVGYEYLNWEGQKFSTSQGIGLFTDEALELFPTDYWRFYLSYILPENKDANFGWEDFRKRINNDLIANYGNLFYRVTHFIKENFEGKVPKGEVDEDGKEVYRKLGDAILNIENHIKGVKLRLALKEIFRFASIVNKYFQDKKPWEKKNVYDVGNTLYTCVNLLRSLSIMLYPYIPSTAETALKSLGVDTKAIKWENVADEKIKSGQKIEAKLLFKKIEDKDLERAKKYVSKYARVSKKGGVKEPAVSSLLKKKEKIKLVDDMLPFEEFQKVELIVGTITSVNDHPKADKLYIVDVDMGSEIRKLVVGLKEKYQKDDLKGKQVIVVANLEPKELRGVKSHGMLLAAEDGTIISPMQPVKNGTKIL